MSPLCRRFVEGDMCFDFDDGWTHLVAWDRHPAYQKGIRKVDGARAVDVIGIYGNDTLFFIEMKDYRWHRTQGKGRSKTEDPWVELELKVRHSVAGLVGAHRRGSHDDTCRPIIEALVERLPLKLVYWLDEAPHSRILETNAEMRRRAGASFHMQELKKHLKWLDARVCSTSSAEDYKGTLPGVHVISLPRDLRERAGLVVRILAERGMDVPEGIQQRLDAWVRDNRREHIDQCLCRAPFVSSARQLMEQRG